MTEELLCLLVCRPLLWQCVWAQTVINGQKMPSTGSVMPRKASSGGEAPTSEKATCEPRQRVGRELAESRGGAGSHLAQMCSPLRGSIFTPQLLVQAECTH